MSSLSLIALPFRWPVSLVSLEVVAMAAGAGRKWEGLVVVTCLGEVRVRRTHFSSFSALATNRVAVTPFLTSASFWSAVGGCFLVVLTGLVATTETAVAFAARVVAWWESSSEHERAGVLQKAKQTKTYCCLVSILYHQTAFFWRSLNEGF